MVIIILLLAILAGGVIIDHPIFLPLEAGGAPKGPVGLADTIHPQLVSKLAWTMHGHLWVPQFLPKKRRFWSRIDHYPRFFELFWMSQDSMWLFFEFEASLTLSKWV